MKKLIFLLVLLISVSILAQNKNESKSALVNDQTDVWMTKISSDPEMRGMMMNLMIMETKDNQEEMQKLVNSILADPEMNKMITRKNTNRANNETVFVEHRGMVPDSINIGKMNKISPVNKK